MNPIFPPGLEWLDPLYLPTAWQDTPLGFLLGGWIIWVADWLRG